MSNLSQQVTGFFNRGTFPGLASDVVAATPPSAYSTGVTIVQPISNSPSLVKPWTIYGWTMQLRIGYNFSGVAGAVPFGRFGDIWGGLLIDTPLQDSGSAANLPGDLSNYGKLWDGENDPIRQVDLPASNTNPLTYQLVPITFMLPSPVVARSGAQLAMGITVLPSIFGSVGNGAHVLTVLSSFYSVLYTE